MGYHKWSRADADIYYCYKCTLYRCHALTDYSSRSNGGAKKLVDVEYSLADGTVISLNPDKQPPCGEVTYA